MTRIHSDHEPGERNVVLRVISTIVIGMGTILLVIGTLLLAFGLYNLVTGQTVTPPSGRARLAAQPVGVVRYMTLLSPFAILWALGIFGAGLEFLAKGYLIRLAIQVEQNTRTSARCLETLSTRATPRADPPGPLFVS